MSRRRFATRLFAPAIFACATGAAANGYQITIETAVAFEPAPPKPAPRALVLIDPDELNHELQVQTALNAHRRVSALKRVAQNPSPFGRTVFSVNNADTGPLLMEMSADFVSTSVDRLAGLPYNREITEHAKQFQLDPALVHALVIVESGHNPRAVSPKGATGLMQLMPGTAERFGVRDRMSPSENIRGGTAYLRFLVDFFEGNLALAVAAYNAGEHAVLMHGRRIPPYAETQAYVPKVLETYRRLRSTGPTPFSTPQSWGTRTSARNEPRR